MLIDSQEIGSLKHLKRRFQGKKKVKLYDLSVHITTFDIGWH